jgi:formylglycine-generating enzyme required for sulfatase activity
MKRIMTLMMVSGWCLAVGCVQTQTKTRTKPDETAKADLTVSGAQTNSLGMIFVPVKGTDVLFSIWETRVQDHQAFAIAKGRKWEKPSFDQGPTHPAVYFSWDDAVEFCAWLTKKERAAGTIGANEEYRLPTDAEWSVAVGLGAESGNALTDKFCKIKGVYPWGKQWPPPSGAGNYSQSLKVDNFEYTSPVGSFAANQFGLFDMGGNVREWCEHMAHPKVIWHLLRGASWRSHAPDDLLSSGRNIFYPGYPNDNYGFRCVLVVGGASSSSR